MRSLSSLITWPEQSLNVLMMACVLVFFFGQAAYTQEDAVAGVPVAEPVEKLSNEELDELVGPFALYPDALIAQILPASTYPLEIVRAARDLEEGGGKLDEEIIKNLEYDPSVLALMHYPEVIMMLNEDIDWTATLGDAVIDQQEDVMAAIQRIRAQAYAAGNLVTNEKIIVVQEKQTIQIVPADPEVIYVPSYDPQVVIVKQEVRTTPVVTFTTGFAVGAWLGYACNWSSSSITVKHKHYWRGVRPSWGSKARWRPDSPWGTARRTSRRTARRTSRRVSRRTGAVTGARAGAVTGRKSGAAAGAAAGQRSGSTAGGRAGTAAGRTTRGTPQARTPSREAYGGYRSGNTARQHSSRGAASRGVSRSGGMRGGGRGGGRRR